MKERLVMAVINNYNQTSTCRYIGIKKDLQRMRPSFFFFFLFI